MIFVIDYQVEYFDGTSKKGVLELSTTSPEMGTKMAYGWVVNNLMEDADEAGEGEYDDFVKSISITSFNEKG